MVPGANPLSLRLLDANTVRAGCTGPTRVVRFGSTGLGPDCQCPRQDFKLKLGQTSSTEHITIELERRWF